MGSFIVINITKEKSVMAISHQSRRLASRSHWDRLLFCGHPGLAEAKDTCQSSCQNLLTAADELTQNLAVFTQELEDRVSIGPHREVDPHPTILIAQF
jgi:hypothetical protein